MYSPYLNRERFFEGYIKGRRTDYYRPNEPRTFKKVSTRFLRRRLGIFFSPAATLEKITDSIRPIVLGF